MQHEGVFAVSYLYISLAFFAVVYLALHFVNTSRTGRAWRSLREDPLAAEAMGMPVNLLKLMAFSFGAAVAALTGTIFAAVQTSVFPLTFSFPLVITVYTMVILGGQGNLAGVTAGAVLVSVMLEFLRDPGDARILFYVVGVLAIAFAFGRTRKLAVVLGSLVVLGFAAHAVAEWINPDWVSGPAANGFDQALSHWLIIPTHLANWVGPVSYIGLVCLVLTLTVLPSRARLILLVPTLYLGTFVWENVLLAQPDSTRFIVLGVMLIGLMIIRPNGLLGERRVEII